VASKKDIRTQLKKSIYNLSKEEYSKKSAEACAQLYEYLLSKSYKNIVIFYSLSDEINSTYFIKKYFNEFSFYLPKIDSIDDKMTIHPLLDLESGLQKGKFSTQEPTEKSCEHWEEIVDCIVVPAIGIDYEGNRLGRGKGYYDKLLSGLKKNLIKIGFIFHLQLFEEIETEKHDIPVDICITEKGTFQMRRK